MARLDRLPIAKEVAQFSAVIGRNFSYALLAAVADVPEPLLAQGLKELVASGLAFQQGVGPDALYAFKHALVRDVASESLPRNRRAQIHASVVTVVETDSNGCALLPYGGGAFCGTRRAGRDQEPPGARVAIRTEPAGRSRSEVA